MELVTFMIRFHVKYLSMFKYLSLKDSRLTGLQDICLSKIQEESNTSCRFFTLQLFPVNMFA